MEEVTELKDIWMLKIMMPMMNDVVIARDYST